MGAFIVLIDSGLPMGELWRLETRDYHRPVQGKGGNGAISVYHGKTNKPRTIPFTTRAADVIKRGVEEHPRGKCFLG